MQTCLANNFIPAYGSLYIARSRRRGRVRRNTTHTHRVGRSKETTLIELMREPRRVSSRPARLGAPLGAWRGSIPGAADGAAIVSPAAAGAYCRNEGGLASASD